MRSDATTTVNEWIIVRNNSNFWTIMYLCIMCKPYQRVNLFQYPRKRLFYDKPPYFPLGKFFTNECNCSRLSITLYNIWRSIGVELKWTILCRRYWQDFFQFFLKMFEYTLSIWILSMELSFQRSLSNAAFIAPIRRIRDIIIAGRITASQAQRTHSCQSHILFNLQSMQPFWGTDIFVHYVQEALVMFGKIMHHRLCITCNILKLSETTYK